MRRTTAPQPQQKPAVPFLHVGSKTGPTKLAGAIKGFALDTDSQGKRIYNHVKARTVGAAAVNQLIKGIAIARRYLRSDRLLPILTVDLVNIEIDGLERSAIETDIYFLCQQD